MPVTRSASLRVAHQRGCPNETKTALESVGKGSGCTCKQPSYYTLHRDTTGRPVKGQRVHDRKVADRALRALLVDIDEGKVGQRQRKPITFKAWADTYLDEIVQGLRGGKGSTRRAYEATLSYAVPIFGHVDISDIGAAELRRFVRAVQEPGEGRKPSSDATVHKHVRHLGAILRGAEEEGLIDHTPLGRKFVRELRLRVAGGVDPWTDDEIGKLFLALAKLKTSDVYVALLRFCLETGARVGETVALNWSDVNLTARRVTIERTWDGRDGAQAPKDGEPRTINLTPAALTVLEDWIAKQGVRPDDSPVFPAPTTGGRINVTYLRKVVDKALAKTDIPKVGPNGRPRKQLHSLRATYTRRMLESGRQPQWVQKQLGHSDPALTLNTYGEWQPDALDAEALDERG